MYRAPGMPIPQPPTVVDLNLERWNCVMPPPAKKKKKINKDFLPVKEIWIISFPQG